MASSATPTQWGGRVRKLTPEPVAWSKLLNPVSMCASLWSSRGLILQFTVREIHGRTRGTRMGAFWSFLGPLLQLVVFTLVFGVLLEGGRWPNRETNLDFAILLFTGMMVFGAFADPLGQAPNLIVSRRNFVKRVVFPLEILSVSSVLAALFYASIGLLLAWIAHLLYRGEFYASALLSPVVILPGVLCALGLSWILAALGVFVRDLNQVVSMFVQRLLFFVSGVFYSVESIPEPYRTILYINPMTSVIEGVRCVMMLGTEPMWWLLGVWTVVGAGLCVGGYALFQRARGGFADVI